MKVSLGVGLVVAAIGVALVVYVAIIWADIDRATTPLAQFSFAELNSDRSFSVEVVIPADWRWRRMADRFDHPKIMIVAVILPSRRQDERRCRALEPYRPEVFLHETAVPLGRFKDSTYLILEDGRGAPVTHLEGLEFDAQPGDRLTLKLKSAVPPITDEGVIILSPLVDSATLKGWFIGLEEAYVLGWILSVVGGVIALTGLVVRIIRARREPRSSLSR